MKCCQKVRRRYILVIYFCFLSLRTLVLCASIYGNKDYKPLVYANWGTNRLGEGSISQPRTRRELSSSIIRVKGPSRNSLSNITQIWNSQASNYVQKPLIIPNSTTTTKAFSHIGFQTFLHTNINELQNSHQHINNLEQSYTDPDFLFSCYMMIKGKAGHMSPVTKEETLETLETLDGIDFA